MSTTLEKTVEAEQAEHDAAQAEDAAAHETGDGQRAAFDASDYDREDLQIQKVDGHGVDKIALRFSGRVMLDRSDPADVALYNRAQLGGELELRVAGKVTNVGTGWATNREGDLDAIVGERTVKVETVWILDPEDL